MKTYTPGPWTVDVPQGMFGYTVFSGGRLICQMTPMLSREEGSKENAALIASAPELLAALRNLYGEIMLSPARFNQLPPLVLEHAAKAISKALPFEGGI